MHTIARHPRLRSPRLRLAAALGAALTVSLAVVGCRSQSANKNPATIIRYADLGARPNVPPFMKGTIWEVANRSNDAEFAASAYGLVSRLRGTGDSTASLPVRQWMTKQMAVHGFGNKLLPEYANIGAEQVFRNPSFAIVRVDGLIPPGAREGEFFDVRVSALPGNRTTSLSGGMLFEADLSRPVGNSPDLNAIAANILARAKGPIVVNPAYALQAAPGAPGVAGGSTQARASLRSGVVMGGGRVMRDRPIVLRLLQPQRSTARYIEQRINQRFQDVADRPRKDVMPATYQVAFALDEGLVEVYVPRAYNGDWEHFMGVVEHLYLNASPANAVARAQELVDAALAEAAKPEPALREISFALEGIGEPALQYVLPLMVHANPDVAFAMARAAAFMGDHSGAAQDALLRIARNDGHKFQVAAIQTLGALPKSAERNQKMRELLDSRNTLARIEAYKVLVRNQAAGTFSKVIGEKFALDLVQSEGEPLIFASRSGIPRIALIGPKPTLRLPVLFTAMDSRLMIASPAVGRNVTIFYRDDRRGEPIQMPSRPDVAELVARLGGEGAPEEERIDFTYGEIVAVLQSLSQQQMVTAPRRGGQLTLAPFIFEQPRDSQDLIESAPVIEQTRPNTDGSARSGEMPPGTEASVARR